MATKPIHFPALTRRSRYGNFKHHNEYKPEIRQDCLQRCVYCDIHEAESGGEESMTLDHFRPKSFPEYKYLEHDPYNLMYACAPCNSLKGNDWPAYGLDGTVNGNAGYVDPFAVNRLDYFAVEKDGSLKPRKDPAKYMIKVLELNRPFLQHIRRKRESIYRSLQHLEEYFETEIVSYKSLLGEVNQKDKIQILRELARLDQMKKLVSELDNLFILL